MSIGKLSQFIDFFNFVPIKVADIRHKNTTSEDLQTFMGKVEDQEADVEYDLTTE